MAMPDTDVTLPDHPVLVVAYDDKSRAALAASLGLFGVPAISCATFVAAESYALTGSCQGILVDLATMIKAKDEEKAVAYTLTGIYPALRVKTMGSMLIPMIMAGDAKQDNKPRGVFHPCLPILIWRVVSPRLCRMRLKTVGVNGG